MIPQQFIDYIRDQIAMGTSQADIVKVLKVNGLSDEDIALGFRAVEPVPTAPGVDSSLVPPVSIPAPMPALAVPLPPTPTTVQLQPMPEGEISKPSTVTFFEFLMYASIIASLAMPFVQFGQYFTSQYFSAFAALMVFFVPLSLAIGRLVLVFLAAHRRMNWARIVLLALFFTHFTELFDIVRRIFSNPVFALLSVVPILLGAAALCFAFLPSANRWFGPLSFTTNSPNVVGVENTTWSKRIPRTNLGFMAVSLLFVFGLDLIILINETDLWPFFVAMLVVLSIFVVFYFIENYVLKKKFSTSRSRLDTWIVVLILVRNIVFVLNFIPGIQILGGAVLVFGGIPFLIIYGLLLSSRSKNTHVN